MINKLFSYKSAAYCLVVFVFSNFALANKIIYVDDDANGANDGSSWQNAYVYLQDALTDANSSEKPVEIRAAQGTYKPDKGAGQTAGDREATFELISGVTLSGGYAGILEPEPNERDYEKYPTNLSGDLAGDDVDVEKLDDLLTELTLNDNCYHVVTGQATDETAIIKGLTITGGNASSNRSGGGIYCGRKIYTEEDGSPTIMQCIIKQNSASRYGGGISDCRGTISECLITENIASNLGGGLYNCEKVTDCEITYNSAGQGGGLSYCYLINHCLISHNNASYSGGGLQDCSTITNCIVNYNSATFGGGGIAFSSPGLGGQVCECIIYSNNAGRGAGVEGSKIVSNCLVIGNFAYQYGGGLSQCTNITNCTIGANKAKNLGGGIYNETINSKFINTILWSNIASYGDQAYLSGVGVGGPPGVGYFFYGAISFQYSNIQGGETGIYKEYEENVIEWNAGNLDTEPLFVNPGYWDPNGTIEDVNDDFWVDGDYHLKSQAGRWNPSSESWVQDDVTSPCIDAGDPNSPIGYEPFPNSGRINMGAYGGTSEASKSYFGKPVCETIVAGDINGDCKVDILDLEIMMLHWLEDRTNENP